MEAGHRSENVVDSGGARVSTSVLRDAGQRGVASLHAGKSCRMRMGRFGSDIPDQSRLQERESGLHC